MRIPTLATGRPYFAVSGMMPAMEQASAGGPMTTVATYGSYGEAERAVDFLSDKGFPVERVAIVGAGLKTVERVTRISGTPASAAVLARLREPPPTEAGPTPDAN